ncbi:hypothetical protein glysoja_025050 [Glycine soja]|uniref:Uncharacterized protein n=1 Tax=Glycine soja TaxID=3848 RepID=A0A0B2QA69_GLYSO|nr:hypothetical protein glysoja_025050 [Glycine soja]
MEAQEFFQNTFCPQFPSGTNITPSNANPSAATADHFLVEDFFDFSNDDNDATAVTDATFDSLPTDVDSPNATPLDSTTKNSNLPSSSSADAHFSVAVEIRGGIVFERGFAEAAADIGCESAKRCCIV